MCIQAIRWAPVLMPEISRPDLFTTDRNAAGICIWSNLHRMQPRKRRAIVSPHVHASNSVRVRQVGYIVTRHARRVCMIESRSGQATRVYFLGPDSADPESVGAARGRFYASKRPGAPERKHGEPATKGTVRSPQASDFLPNKLTIVIGSCQHAGLNTSRLGWSSDTPLRSECARALLSFVLIASVRNVHDIFRAGSSGMGETRTLRL